MVNTNRNDIKVQCWVDLKALISHFNASSKMSKCLADLLKEEKSIDYFMKTLYNWIERKREEIDDEDFLNVFSEATDLEYLNINININFMKLCFNKAMNEWLVSGGDLDDAIIKKMTFESYKEVIDGLLEIMKQVLDSPNSFERYIMNEQRNSDFEDLFDEGDIYRMPKENNNRIN